VYSIQETRCQNTDSTRW